MSGEINGTKALLYRVAGSNLAIIGQLELSNTFNATPIDISTKSDSDFVRLQDGELSTKGRTLSGTLVYNSDAEYIRIKESAKDGTIESYMLDYTGQTADQISFNGIPNGLSDALPTGDKVTTTINILSTGADS